MKIEKFTSASRERDNAGFRNTSNSSVAFVSEVSRNVAFRAFCTACARTRAGLAALISLVALLGQTHMAQAVIFWSTSDPNHNTTEPVGALAGSGWQFEGKWGSFLGTVIAPQYFVTAKHVGGSIGQTFAFQGVNYTTIALFDDPNTDLRIWKISGTFPAFAELYTGSDEAGKNLVVIGRGTQRGSQVIVTGSETNYLTNYYTVSVTNTMTVTGTNYVTNIVTVAAKHANKRKIADVLISANVISYETNYVTSYETNSVTTEIVSYTELKGWQWGAGDGAVRWGENTVYSAAGNLLRACFDAGAGTNEAHLSSGDSGGAVFIHDGTGWKLAGINYAVDGPYQTALNGPSIHGAFFDLGGLYKGTYLIPETEADRPTNFYATRISARLSWIAAVIAQP